MTRKLLMISVLAVSLAVPALFGRPSVAAGPKPAPVAACKDDLGKLQKELVAAREAQRKAEADAAEARAELEKVKAAERQRIKRLEAQTGVAMDRLR